MKPYSVLLLTPDYLAIQYGEDTYYAHVTAGSRDDAIAAAQAEAWDAIAAAPPEPGDEPADFAPLLVIAGHHEAL